MDGVNNRLKYLPNSVDYDNKISKSEYDALCKQIESSKNNCNGTINHCVSEIHSLSFYHGQMYVIDELIKSQNWKFKTFGSANRNNSYSWLVKPKLISGLLDNDMPQKYVEKLMKKVSVNEKI